jgi:hypothetical protein
MKDEGAHAFAQMHLGGLGGRPGVGAPAADAFGALFRRFIPVGGRNWNARRFHQEPGANQLAPPSASFSPSKSWIGAAGMTVEIACL